MKNKFWQLIAYIVTITWVKDALIKIAMRNPYEHLGGYMHRYWLVPESWNLPFSIRIHHILRADADNYLHDHPFNWRTIILDGWYIEENVFGETNARITGHTVSAQAETFHRITDVNYLGVWTLFIMGKHINKWGFMVNNEKGVPRKICSRDYQSTNGRDT